MDKRLKMIKLHLFGGSAYFLIAGMLHYSGTKWVGFYIFFDLPSQAYQDRLIAVLALGWAAMYALAAVDPLKYFDLTWMLVLIGGAGLLGTAGNVLLTDFNRFSDTGGTWPYWVQIFGLVFYILVLGLMNWSLARVRTPILTTRDS